MKGADIVVKVRASDGRSPPNRPAINSNTLEMESATENSILSIPTPALNSFGGCVNLVSRTIAYDSDSCKVKSNANPFISVTSKLAISSHSGSFRSRASTLHWNVGFTQTWSIAPRIEPPVTISQPCPLSPRL